MNVHSSSNPPKLETTQISFKGGTVKLTVSHLCHRILLSNKMNKVLIIAEAGVNHNGSMDMAKQLVDLAYDCGVDIVKFQTTKLEALATKAAPMAEYQVNNTNQKMNQQEVLKNVILSYDEHRELYQYCKEKGIEYLSTPFDIGSIHFLNDMVSFWKVPSGEITNYPYLREIGKTKKDKDIAEY